MLLRLRKDGVTIIIICTEENREGSPVKRARRRAGNNNLSRDTDTSTGAGEGGLKEWKNRRDGTEAQRRRIGEQ